MIVCDVCMTNEIQEPFDTIQLWQNEGTISSPDMKVKCGLVLCGDCRDKLETIVSVLRRRKDFLDRCLDVLPKVSA